MRRMRYSFLLVASALLLVGGFAPNAANADPMIDGIVFDERVFNDCPISLVTSTDAYPASINIRDENLICPTGFANLHAWTLSDDGGATGAEFSNSDNFKLSATLTITGPAEGEAGLRVSPWYSQLADGRFNVRSSDGEIACFGGRLPFYSFTATHGINYVKGDDIYLEVVYMANGLSMADPATIEYKVTYGGMNYTSGPLAFDEGNPAEDPPYGLWGMLNDARVGGYVQVFIQSGDALNANWRDVNYMGLTPVQVYESSWGQVKNQYR